MSRRAPLALAAMAVCLLIAATGCFQRAEREMPASPTRPATPATAPSPTAAPPPAETPTATALPSPTSPPTATPAVTPKVVPTVPPTALPTPTPTPAPTPTALSPTPFQLFLEIQGPEDLSTLANDVVVVHGVTSRGASVRINGNDTEVDDDGRFRAAVELSPGVNAIEVVATDAGGNRQSSVFTVTSLALPPQPSFLLITEPKDQSIVSESPVRLFGRTRPDAVVSVNGVNVPVDELGIFSTRVTLEPGPNIIEVVASQVDGKILSAIIAVIFRS